MALSALIGGCLLRLLSVSRRYSYSPDSDVTSASKPLGRVRDEYVEPLSFFPDRLLGRTGETLHPPGDRLFVASQTRTRGNHDRLAQHALSRIEGVLRQHDVQDRQRVEALIGLRAE